MMIWKIALFIFIFNFMLTMGTGLNSEFGFETTIPQTGEFLNEAELNRTELKIKSILENEKVGGEVSYVVESLKLFVMGIIIFGQTIINTAVFTEAFLNNITGGHLPSIFILLIGLVTRLIFIVGMVQLVTGKSLRDML